MPWLLAANHRSSQIVLTMAMSASDWAAWYGASVASAVFAWDIIKWRRKGARLSATVMGRPGRPSDLELVVGNSGDAPALVHLPSFRLFIGSREIELSENVLQLRTDAGRPPWTVGPGAALRCLLEFHGAFGSLPDGKVVCDLAIPIEGKRKPLIAGVRVPEFEKFVEDQRIGWRALRQHL